MLLTCSSTFSVFLISIGEAAPVSALLPQNKGGRLTWINGTASRADRLGLSTGPGISPSFYRHLEASRYWYQFPASSFSAFSFLACLEHKKGLRYYSEAASLDWRRCQSHAGNIFAVWSVEPSFRRGASVRTSLLVRFFASIVE